MDFRNVITENNATHVVEMSELEPLLHKAQETYSTHFDNSVWFERSVFINWTCGIADCKYCYLSTTPKLQKHSIRSPASILAEIIICNAMKWKVGYITGGLRVESTEYLVELLKKINYIQESKVKMNFGPYADVEIDAFAPHISGMGAAIESFDEELHNYICPSKPLASLKKTLASLKKRGLSKFITIILGIGEKKSDVETVIEYVNEYGIDMVQLCFLKPLPNTEFSDVPPPNPEYMAYWIAKLRIAHPKLILKIALVRERIGDTSLYLKAGANCFSRFQVFKDFGSEYATQLESECRAVGRALEGSFTTVPELDVNALVDKTPFDDELKETIRKKAAQYYSKLVKKGTPTSSD